MGDFDGDSLGSLRQQPNRFFDGKLLLDMMISCASGRQTLVSYWIKVVVFNYLKKQQYQVEGYEAIYPTLEVKQLYDMRQNVNPVVYDFAQMYMDHPDQAQRFGCKC